MKTTEPTDKDLTDKVIAIDGPSGSGKSTIAKIVAQKLNLTYLDTGAMFRSLAYVLDAMPIDFSKSELSSSETDQIQYFLNQMNFEYGVSADILIRVNGEDLTSKIREHQVSAMASKVSKFSIVRDFLALKQRQIASSRASILEGRDIGTVIFPKAALKIFLTASPEIRAQRRYDQLVEKDPVNKEKYDVKSIAQDIFERDQQDQKRAIAPLKKADDAIEIDTSAMGIEEVCEQIISEYHKKKNLFD